MASTSQKILSGGFLLLLLLGYTPPLFSKPNRSFVIRKWVVKLKQNSFFNRRPFQFASPASHHGKIFVGTHRGFFYAVDAKKGEKVWTFKTQGPIHAEAASDERGVYFADMKGIVYALDLETGKPLWMTKLENPVMSAPLIVQDKLYVVSLSKELTCLEKEKGTVLWQEVFGTRDSGFTVHGSSDPVLAGPLILIGYSDGMLMAHRPENGAIAWTKQLGNPYSEFHDVDSTPFIVTEVPGVGPLQQGGGGRSPTPGTAFVSSADGRLVALDPSNGEILWEGQAGGVNDAVAVDSLLYVTAGGVVSCFEAKTGQILWEQDLKVPELSSPAVYKDWLIVTATKGRTYFLNRQSGDILHTWYVRGGSYSDPLMDDSQAFILSNAGKLYSFQFR